MTKVMAKPTQALILRNNPQIGKTRGERAIEIRNRETACKLLRLRLANRLTTGINQKLHSTYDGFNANLDRVYAAFNAGLKEAYDSLNSGLKEVAAMSETRNKSGDILGMIESWAEAYINDGDKSYRHVAMDYIRKTFKDSESRAAAKAYFDIRARQYATAMYEGLGLPVSHRHSPQDYARIISNRQFEEDARIADARYNEEPESDGED